MFVFTKSPSAKKIDDEVKKDEAVNDKEGDPMSPPKLIEDGKQGRKKLKGVSSWAKKEEAVENKEVSGSIKGGKSDA
ncbi:hypothetical protein Tco_0483922 [Tanacetum coccineum]